ncbi:type II secretion system F family protein [Pseudonocardia sp. DLS-67]
MNSVLVVVLLAGGVLGIGVALGVSAFVRGWPLLGDALAALDERTPAARLARNRCDPLGLARRLPGHVPTADLTLLGWTSERFLLGRVKAAALYGASGPALASVLAALDIGMHVVVPAGFTIAGVVVGWSAYGRQVSDRAEAAREELRHALVAYLQQVSLLRRGGAGVVTALTVPAQLLADGWAMRRIRDELDDAARAGHMPWEGLRRLGERVEIGELADLSTIAATAGQDGGAVIDTLLARADSLQDELRAEEHAEAHRASGRMSTPGALQVFLISAWVLYPAGVALLTI